MPLETVALWLKGITGNQDNLEDPSESSLSVMTTHPTRYFLRSDCFPLAFRLCLVLADSCFGQLALQVFTEMYSMPNGEQDLAQDQEGEDSA